MKYITERRIRCRSKMRQFQNRKEWVHSSIGDNIFQKFRLDAVYQVNNGTVCIYMFSTSSHSALYHKDSSEVRNANLF